MNLNCYKKNKLPATYTKEFRDLEMWRELKKIIDNEFKDKDRKELKIFRVWSAGCAGGEEVVSLILFLEKLLPEASKQKTLISIYGTDIREDKLIEALSKVNESKEKIGFNIRIRKHDLVSNEPLKLMNLILCRNVLMYFKPVYQDLILQKLHQSLKKGGYLVLGKAEHLRGEAKDKFKVIDKKLRIFQKR